MTKNDKINFSTPSGFPEFLPSEKRLEVYFLDIIRKVFECYGFSRIVSPGVVRLDVLDGC
ncbi:MAG: histidine--tRNA ligase, partial [Dolichospermum sp.]